MDEARATSAGACARCSAAGASPRAGGRLRARPRSRPRPRDLGGRSRHDRDPGRGPPRAAGRDPAHVPGRDAGRRGTGARRVVDEAFAAAARATRRGALRARADRLGVDLALTTDARMSVLSLGCTHGRARQRCWRWCATCSRTAISTSARSSARNMAARSRVVGGAEEPADRCCARAVRRAAVRARGSAPLAVREAGARRSGDLKTLLAARDTLVRLPGRVVGLAGDLDARRGRARRGHAAAAAALGAPPASSPCCPRRCAREEPARADGDARAAHPGLLRRSCATARRSTDPDYPAFLSPTTCSAATSTRGSTSRSVTRAGDTYATGTIREGEPAAGAVRRLDVQPHRQRRRDRGQAARGAARLPRAGHHRGGARRRRRASSRPALVQRPVARPGARSHPVGAEPRPRRPATATRLVERAAALPLDEINALRRPLLRPRARSR